ncbi:uroporphyrinogen-III C-methyltransferase [Belliella kenyensis]|uniref:uroporphyrinogen-III C-methyltransferase n=1 Tax=Belliella kenyensis TaxID=1472724 RepID=A0ABV8ENR1_9BACT|nr:uroporphyrinogen-III C-methyltransferase [Belliella kenyensis]MCH7400818.1 uroporphyrinogen-III C-methyltransferase [Belliella kenyensis]MDN3601894.1 uroporphyrinogen-III C-methyltransferase [Belliella kenyensis]
MNTEAKLTLVGAGPGDPELITLKGLKAIQSAAVILYDALINEALLDHAHPTCLKVFVGKRAGHHYKQQEEINEMIIGYARAMGHVVRLKGGDPFVFGRGHEEMEFVSSHGIPSTYIPGISSALSVPGLAGIPITKRLINESFMVVTGTLKDGSLSKDIKMAAQSNTTTIILMGINKLDQIIEIFKKERGGDEPIALIQHGSLPQEKSLFGTLSAISDLQKIEQITSPAIIIIGQVVKEKLEHNSYLIDQNLQAI